jgi:hypothetical protein
VLLGEVPEICEDLAAFKLACCLPRGHFRYSRVGIEDIIVVPFRVKDLGVPGIDDPWQPVSTDVV